MWFPDRWHLLGLAICRPLCFLVILFLSLIMNSVELMNLSSKVDLDVIYAESKSGDYYYALRCWTAHEDHTSGVISQIANAFWMFQFIQIFPQAILISQKRWARTAKTLSIVLTSTTMAFLIAISVKAGLLVRELEATGPFPELEEYCSTSRTASRAYFDVWNASGRSLVRPVIICGSLDCALKVGLIIILFVLPTPIRIPIPFEPIVAGSKASSLIEDDAKYPETGPVSEAWKNLRQRCLSRDDAFTTVIFTENNTNQPSWVLSKRLTRMPVVTSESPRFSPQIQHWTQDRYRRLRRLIPFLLYAILLDIVLLCFHFFAPNANEKSCTSLCQLQIVSLCGKPILLLISCFIVKRTTDLQKYKVKHVSLWHVVSLLWCILPFFFPAPFIIPFLTRDYTDLFMFFLYPWLFYTIFSGILGCSITFLLLTVISTRLRHSNAYIYFDKFFARYQQ